MLNKRTNILFDEEMWKKLSSLARAEMTSVGELVRKAVIAVYITPEDKKIRQRENAFDQIERIKQDIRHTFSHKEIKELIEYGRKY